MQLSDIRTRVRYGLREATASVWSDAEITAEINLAQRYIALHVPVKYLPDLIQIDTDTFVAGTAHYDLDTSFLKMASDVDVGASTFTLVTYEEVIKAMGYSANHALYGCKLAYVSNYDLYLYPVTAPTAGQTLTWFYVKAPTDLSNDTDASKINDAIINLVVDLATANCLKKTNIQKAAELKDFVDKSIKAMQ
jgi:hypothetical protein